MSKLEDVPFPSSVGDVKIVSGVGNPASPLFGTLLTMEEEKKTNENGEPIVTKAPWSDVPTGIYLTVAVSGQVPFASRQMIGGQTTNVPRELTASPRYITIGTFVGKPTFNVPFAGAALEVPADLTEDALKRTYVTEWLVETTKEALLISGVDLGGDALKCEALGLWLADAAQAAMERAM